MSARRRPKNSQGIWLPFVTLGGVGPPPSSDCAGGVTTRFSVRSNSNLPSTALNRIGSVAKNKLS